MKKLLTLFAAVLCAATASAQIEIDVESPYGPGKMPFNDEGQVVFSKVVHVEGKDKAQLYSMARLLITEMFKSAKDVIQLEDKDGGVIVAKGWSEANEDHNCQIWYTLRIQCRDGRYKIDIYQIKGHKPSDYTLGVVIPPVNIAAEELTDFECLKPNGTIKLRGKGFWRRSVIDAANSLMATIEYKMSQSTTAIDTSEDW